MNNGKHRQAREICDRLAETFGIKSERVREIILDTEEMIEKNYHGNKMSPLDLAKLALGSYVGDERVFALHSLGIRLGMEMKRMRDNEAVSHSVLVIRLVGEEDDRHEDKV